MTKKVFKRYSEAFRIEVVREYEKEGVSLNALRKRYGMSQATLRKWIERYSIQGIRHQYMVIQTPEEQDQMKVLEQRNKQLEKLVAQLSLDKLMLESTLEVIKREYGIDVKKNEQRSSKQPTDDVEQNQ